jgi:hypothetical protein
MKNKTPKPRVMWANYYHLAKITHPVIYPTRAQAIAGAVAGVPPVRVAVIPLDDVEAIVEQATTAHILDDGYTYGDGIRAALTAAGIPCTKRKARK